MLDTLKSGDTYLDMAVVARYAFTPADTMMDSVAVLIQSASHDGAFGIATSYLVGNGPRSLTTADVDGDGDRDLVVANWGDLSDPTSGYKYSRISVLQNNGSGVFATQQMYYTPNRPRTIRAFDFDGDANPDFAVTSETRDSATIYRGNGSGGFMNPVRAKTGAFPQGIGVANFDHKFGDDLATANQNGASVSVLLKTDTDKIANGVTYTVGAGPHRSRNAVAAASDGGNRARPPASSVPPWLLCCRATGRGIMSRTEARVAKLADALDLGSSEVTHGGSSPPSRTTSGRPGRGGRRPPVRLRLARRRWYGPSLPP